MIGLANPTRMRWWVASEHEVGPSRVEAPRATILARIGERTVRANSIMTQR